jgi:hypothetical protein
MAYKIAESVSHVFTKSGYLETQLSLIYILILNLAELSMSYLKDISVSQE